MKSKFIAGPFLLFLFCTVSFEIVGEQNQASEQNKMSLISNRIGGWGPFYFGMPYADARKGLEFICFEVEVISSEITGKYCGTAYESDVDISLRHDDSFFWFNRRLAGVSLAFKYSEDRFKKLNWYFEKWFGPPLDSFGCDEHADNYCQVSYGKGLSSTRIIWFQRSLGGPETIDVSFSSLEDY
jgi:hypothetical protein